MANEKPQNHLSLNRTGPTQEPKVTEQLLELATQLDGAGHSLRSQVTTSIATDAELNLTEQERSELVRIQETLEFINQICPLPASTASIDPSLHETPTGTKLPTPVASMAAPTFQKDHPVLSHVGRFEIIKKLGEGGFAKVYLANDPFLNRKVALKLLRSSLFYSEDVINRFEREAQAAAILNHPNIVPVYESGSLDGERFIASAYCEGQTLEQWLAKQDTVEPDSAAAIVAVLADAVEHAHQRGIIHRDLKPANVLLVTKNSKLRSASPLDRDPNLPGQLRIADFGLAKHAGTTDQMETTEGSIVGTPAYMSPEQARGKTSIGATSDIYSLGVILYELLTGELPILGDSNIDTLIAIRNQDPKSPRRIRGSIPRDIEAICLKCLAKDSAARYATARELALDLRRWSSGEPILARRTSILERTTKWIRRNPVLAGAFACVTLAMFAAMYQWRNAAAETNRAEMNFHLAKSENERAEKHLLLSQDVIDQMVSQVATDDNLPPSLRRSIAEKATKFQDQLLEDTKDDPTTIKRTMLAYNRLARLLFDLSDYDEALKAAEASVRASDGLHENSPHIAEIRASALNIKANVLTVMQRDREAEAVSANAANLAPHNKSISSANRFALAMAKLNRGEFAPAIEAFKASLDLLTDAEHPHRRIQAARANFFWARAEMGLKQFDVARKKTLQARDVYQALFESGHKKDPIREDLARCDIQLVEIQTKQLNVDSTSDEKQALMELAIVPVDRAIQHFVKLTESEPLIARLWGQLAYCYYLKAAVHKTKGDHDALDVTTKQYDDLVKAIGESNIHRDSIRATFIQVCLMHAELNAEEEHIEKALEQTQAACELCQEFLDESKDQTSLNQRLGDCKQLLKVLNERHQDEGSQDMNQQ